MMTRQKKISCKATGSGGTFKSTSGWQDGKYYCFNNDAPPGAIIKVTDNLTNKSVYAKVLDAIPDIKQKYGLLQLLLAIRLQKNWAQEINSIVL